MNSALETIVTRLIPQRPPFVMIDSLLEDDDHLTRTSFSIKADNLFLEEGHTLSPSALVENIAQTAAAGAGYKAARLKQPVQIGFIGAVKNLLIHELPKAGQTLITETSLLNTVFNVSIVEGKIFCGGKLLASCEMKIFLQP